MIVSSPILDEVRHLRVTPENPATSDDDHLDYERCAALHNAIFKHAWVSSGRNLDNLPLRREWPPTDNAMLQECQERLHPDLISFLKIAIGQSKELSFWYSLPGLYVIDEFYWESVEPYDEDCVALYMSNDDSRPWDVGIIYDQEYHYCRYEASCHDGDFPESPAEWQRLETMLSAWINLIERGKVVALHDSVASVADNEHSADKEGISFKDEITGAQRLVTGIREPWEAVPFAKQDLADTLDAWHALIKAINDKSPEPRSDPFSYQGLYSRETLQAAEIRENGFAWEFFTTAWRPTSDIRNLGPDLRLATDEELISNLWKNAQDPAKPEFCAEDILGFFNFPVPILLGNRQSKNWFKYPRRVANEITWGLYLEGCEVHGPLSVEDGCRLALPYSVGANGLALRADGSALNARHVKGEFALYQMGQNPFAPCKPTQLYRVLAAFAHHVDTGVWKVGANGVDELDTVFQDADTENGRYEYMVSI